MKKFVMMLLLAAFTFSVVGCGESKPAAKPADKAAEKPKEGEKAK